MNWASATLQGSQFDFLVNSVPRGFIPRVSFELSAKTSAASFHDDIPLFISSFAHLPLSFLSATPS